MALDVGSLRIERLMKFIDSCSWLRVIIMTAISVGALLFLMFTDAETSTFVRIMVVIISIVCFVFLFSEQLKLPFGELWDWFKWIGVSLAINFVLAIYLTLFLREKIQANENSAVGESTPFSFILPLMLEAVFQLVVFYLFLKIFRYFFKKGNNIFIASVVVTCLVFGLFHLQAYQGNLLQCLLLIGIPSLSQIIILGKYNNFWSVYLIHYLFDTILAILLMFR